MKCRGPGHLKFSPQNYCASCLPPAHASKPSQGLSLCHYQPEGHRDGAEPCATVSLLEASSHSQSLTLGANSYTKVLTPDRASCSQYKWPQLESIVKVSLAQDPQEVGVTIVPVILEEGLLSSGGAAIFRNSSPVHPASPLLATPHLEGDYFGSGRNP